MKKVLLYGVILVVFGVVMWIGYQYLNSKPVSYLTIDINPSVELVLDSNDKVVDVIALNEDGDVITSDLDLIGLSAEEASEKVVQAAIDAGYIDELSEDNDIVVTSSTEDEDERTGLEEKVMNRLNARLEDKKVYALVSRGLTDELKTEADKYDISYGKMLLVNKATTLNTSLVKDDLVALSIQDIQREIKASVKARIEAKKTEHQQLVAQWKELKQQKINAAKEKMELAREKIWNENKNQYKNATTEEKREIINQLVNNAKARIKDRIQERRENKQEQ